MSQSRFDASGGIRREFSAVQSNYDETINLLNKSVATIGQYINSSTGGLSLSGAYGATEYIKVSAGLPYLLCVSGIAKGGQQSAWYDGNKTFISGFSTSSSGNIAPEGAVYVRTSFLLTLIDSIMFVQGTVAPISYIEYGIKLKKSVLPEITPNRNKNLIYYTLGDSLVDMEYWQALTAERLGINSYVNLGVGGSKISQNSLSIVDQLASITSDADIISVWGGTNDLPANITLGTLSSDTTTFLGALKHIIEYISTNHLQAKFLFITPLQRFDFTPESTAVTQDVDGVWRNAGGLSLEDYANAIIDTCKKYGIQCLDLYHSGGINEFNEANFLSDGLHINNTTGGNHISALVANKIATLI